MTRREMILGAGALVGSQAVGRPVRSILGKVGAEYGEASEPFVNPYVTDGLVAMWDGKWNVGLGRYNPQAKIWKDLVGSKDLTVTSAGTFIDGYLSCSGTKYAAYSTGGMTGIVSVECGFRFFSGSIIAQIQNNGTYRGLYNGIRAGRLAIGGIGMRVLSIVHNQFATYSYVFSPFLARCNGYEADTSTHDYTQFGFTDCMSIGGRQNNATGGAKVDVLFMRLYNRALTVNEIAYNYSIDKERFGL